MSGHSGITASSAHLISSHWLRNSAPSREVQKSEALKIITLSPGACAGIPYLDNNSASREYRSCIRRRPVSENMCGLAHDPGHGETFAPLGALPRVFDSVRGHSHEFIDLPLPAMPARGSRSVRAAFQFAFHSVRQLFRDNWPHSEHAPRDGQIRIHLPLAGTG
jgi:hypothetical protein